MIRVFRVIQKFLQVVCKWLVLSVFFNISIVIGMETFNDNDWNRMSLIGSKGMLLEKMKVEFPVPEFRCIDIQSLAEFDSILVPLEQLEPKLSATEMGELQSIPTNPTLAQLKLWVETLETDQLRVSIILLMTLKESYGYNAYGR